MHLEPGMYIYIDTDISRERKKPKLLIEYIRMYLKYGCMWTRLGYVSNYADG